MKSSAVPFQHLIAGGLLLTAALPAAQAQFFANGSFESQSVSGFALINPGGVDSGVVTGWSTGGNPASGLYLASGTTFGLAPYDGAQYVSFNGGETPSGGTLSQTFSTTIGGSYSVSYAVGRLGAGAIGVPVSLSLHGEILSAASAVLAQADSSPVAVGWLAPTTFSFIATTTTTTIRFTDTTTAGGSADVALDAVSVTAVPEPEAYAALAGVALVAFGVSRRFLK